MGGVQYKKVERVRHNASPKGKTMRSRKKVWNDPSAGSPTETLLRLLLPLNVKVYTSSQSSESEFPHNQKLVPRIHRNIQSVGATGGVYKGQGRNQCGLMTRAY